MKIYRLLVLTIYIFIISIHNYEGWLWFQFVQLHVANDMWYVSGGLSDSAGMSGRRRQVKLCYEGYLLTNMDSEVLQIMFPDCLLYGQPFVEGMTLILSHFIKPLLPKLICTGKSTLKLCIYIKNNKSKIFCHFCFRKLDIENVSLRF